jgi:predicted nucleotide-binding protein (sugar kinase/HSP70/actin superfamily)
MKYLPVRTNGSPSDLPWRYSADMHNAARALTAGNGIHPVVISNFSCGPDAFAFPQIEGLLDDRPHLVLEFDEHRGEAGLITRLEAFLDQLDQARTPDRPAAAAGEAAADSRSIPAEPAEVYVPYFADHAYAFSGLWKIRGHNVTVLPPPDSRIRALGEEHSLGKECHAFSMIAGDLLNLDRIRDGRHVVFYVPGTNIPCLLHEYGPGMQRLLQKVGIEGIRVSMPTGTELFETFGLEGLERLYLGILAIELLVKAVCAIRPYEIERGRTDRIHQDNLERIEAAVARGDVLEALDEALSRLAAIPVARSRPRPVVGIAGDIYTRVNPSVNDDLFRWLEYQGLEVWPSPFQIDLLDFGISRRFYQSMARLQLADLLKTGGIALRRELHHWRVRRMVGERIPHPEEPGYLDMQKMAAPYMPIEAHELLFLNVARIVDFARCGADGVINAICFNCMVGNASAAIIEKIRRDYHGVPIITAVYAGGEDPSRRMVLEAFVNQVKAHHRRRTSEPE